MKYGKGASLTSILAARAADAPPSDDRPLADLTKAELVRVAADRGMDAEGTKAELVARLENG